MCGIAGYSLSPRSRVDRTLAAQALLAAIAERGADAVGYAHRSPGARYPTVTKQRTPRLEAARARRRSRRRVAAARARARLHEGPSVDRRQQPPRPARPGGRDPQRDHRQRRRVARRAPVRADRAGDDGRLGGDLRARRALAQRRARVRGAPRRDGRGLARRARARRALPRARCRTPLWLGECRDGVLFASTEQALAVAGEYCGLRLRRREVDEGTLLDLHRGRSCAGRASAPPTTSRAIRCPPCGPRTSATSA